jgi:restriction endonuclease
MKNYSFVTFLAIAMSSALFYAPNSQSMFDLNDFDIFYTIATEEASKKSMQEKNAKLATIRDSILTRQDRNRAASKIQLTWQSYKHKKLVKSLQSEKNLLKKQLLAMETNIEFNKLNDFDQKAYSLAADLFSSELTTPKNQAEFLLSYPMLLTYYPYLADYKK